MDKDAICLSEFLIWFLRRCLCSSLFAVLLLIAAPGLAQRNTEALVGQEPARNPDDLTSRVRQEVLSQLNPVRVNVSIKGITTLQFPSTIEAIDGDGFATGAEQTNAEFSVSTGANWISLKALREGVQQNLNVILKGRVYPIVLTYADEHDYSVLFSFRDNSAIPGVANSQRSKLKQKPINAGRLLGFLDKVKGYPTFSQVQPAMYVNMDVSEPSAAGKGVDEMEHLRCEIKRVIRDNALDAVGFDVEVSNKTDQMIYYDPEGFAARVGNEVYAQTISDAPGKIEPKGKQTIFFVIAGSAESTHHNDLSVYNDFSTVIRELKGNG
jgi:hypothetical protein